VLPRERPGARYNYHLFPVLLRNGQEREAVRARMWSKFVDTSTIYSHAIEECRRYGYRGGCPVAESVSERLVTLPNHASLTGQDIDAVAEVFLSSLRASRSAQPAFQNLETTRNNISYASDS
jgi:perosamine synthetase